MNFNPVITDLTVRATHYVSLTEAINSHPTLSARLTVAETHRKLLESIGKSVSWSLDNKELFRGYLTDVRISDNDLLVIASGETVKRDLVRRTCSFSGDAQPKAINELLKNSSVLQGIKGGDKLARKVEHLWQFNETDWNFLIRIAGICGMTIRVWPEKVSVFDGTPIKTVELTESDIIRQSETISARLGIANSESLTWDTATGKIPNTPAKGRISDQGILSAILNCSEQVAGSGLCHQHFGVCFGDQNQFFADCAARAGMAGLMHWQGTLRNWETGIGDAIKLRSGHPLDIPMLVYQRTLTFQPAADFDQCVNEISCIPAAGGIAAFFPAERYYSSICMTGQVADVKDKKRLGRIKVNFPWQLRKGEKSENWQGVWCQVPQPFGGISLQKKRHGSLSLPSPYDWVRVLLDPNDTEPPVVLGAVYRENAKIPEPAGNPEHDRVLLYTGAGIRIIAKDVPQGKGSTLRLAIENAENGELCSEIILSADGKIKLIAKEELVLNSKIASVEASDNLNIKAKTSIEGTLDVK